MALADQPRSLFCRQLAGELPMASVGEIDQREDRAPVVEMDRRTVSS